MNWIWKTKLLVEDPTDDLNLRNRPWIPALEPEPMPELKDGGNTRARVAGL